MKLSFYVYEKCCRHKTCHLKDYVPGTWDSGLGKGKLRNCIHTSLMIQRNQRLYIGSSPFEFYAHTWLRLVKQNFNLQFIVNMDISEYQTNLITNEQRQYILLPASTENPRNISSEPMAHPPPFMSSVQEMRERYLARKEKHGDEEKSMGGMKKLVQSWKTKAFMEIKW